MAAKSRFLAILIMFLILIISGIHLGVNIDIICAYRQFGDMFHPQRSLAVFNIISSSYGIIIGIFGLIAIITVRPTLSKITSTACFLLGLCALASLITALIFNALAIDYVSASFVNNMNLYKDNANARNTIDMIQTKYDCCGDNIWLDWASVSLDGASLGITDTTTKSVSYPTTIDTGIYIRSSTTQPGIGLGANLYPNLVNNVNMGTNQVLQPKPIGDTNTYYGTNDNTLYKGYNPSYLNRAIRRRRQTEINYGNIRGLPISFGIPLPQSCCTNDAPTTINSFDPYCISNANNVPNSFHIDGCSKKIGKVAVSQTLCIVVISSFLLALAIGAIPTLSKIHPTYSNTYRRSSMEKYQTPTGFGLQHSSDPQIKNSISNHNADYSIFQ